MGSRAAMAKVIIKELESFKKEYAKPRKTVIDNLEEAVVEEKKIEEMDVVFLMDRFGYAKTVDVATYERNKEAANTENRYILTCKNTDKICIFTNKGQMHLLKVLDLPYGKFRDKGTPIDNLSKFDATKERPVCVVNAAQLKGQKLLFATKDAMIKIVPGGEFENHNRTVAATKLQENDMLLSVQPADGMKEAVIQTTSGIFLRFPIEEISEMKKNAKGVRGIKLGRTESLETIHLLDGTVIESSGSMDELARQLADYPGFLRPHRSYLVNMEYIHNITAKSITMESLAEVPLPHGRFTAVRDQYLEYAFAGKKVVL